MRDLIITIFGEYQPVTYEVIDAATGAVSTVIPQGAAGVDWTYIGGVVLFGIVLFCFFRLLGGMFKR